MSTDLKLSRDKVSGEEIDEGSAGVNRFEGQLAGVPEEQRPCSGVHCRAEWPVMLVWKHTHCS